MSLLKCIGVHKRFASGLVGVDDVTLALEQGRTYALLGPSGCGKTTLLRLVAGLEVPDRGEIWLRETRVNNPSVQVPPEKRHIGMVFQNLALWPHMTVIQHLTLGSGKHDRAVWRQRAEALLADMGLDGRLTAFPHQLSGGEQQRLALARALIRRPDLLLLDEPLTNLDAPLKQGLIAEIDHIRRQGRVTIVLVTHAREDAFALADQLLIMQQGRIVQQGTPEAVYRRPVSPFVARLLGPAGLLMAESNAGLRLVSSLGTAAHPCAGPGSQALVLFRPDDLGIAVNGDGAPAVVRSGRFDGGRWLWQVELGGELLPMFAAGPPPIGETVSIVTKRQPTVLSMEAPYDQHVHP